jgi:hypothetical protein
MCAPQGRRDFDAEPATAAAQPFEDLPRHPNGPADRQEPAVRTELYIDGMYDGSR